MKIFRTAVIAISGFSALSLAACGEGYEMVKVRNQVPYTEERTAGPGVAYVRAHLMPEKSVILEPQTTVTPQAVATPVETTAEPMFTQTLGK